VKGISNGSPSPRFGEGRGGAAGWETILDIVSPVIPAVSRTPDLQLGIVTQALTFPSLRDGSVPAAARRSQGLTLSRPAGEDEVKLTESIWVACFW